MNRNTRKSTALVSLVLVPLNLLGLGFAGCDSQDDNSSPSITATESGNEDEGQVDFAEADDGFNLDPVPNTGGVGPVVDTTQPLAQSTFASQPAHPATYSASHYHHSGGGVVFLPIPYRTGYAPPYRPVYRSSPVNRSSPSFARSSSGSSSGVSRSSSSSSVSRGGFGSTGHAASASS
jgi:hypothetical protein